jgi:glycosyltransferase involved in cell wall biosynthesis
MAADQASARAARPFAVRVTVAIPVLDGAATLPAVLDAVRAQDVGAEIEIVVCDSGSTDGSRAIAERHGAVMFDIQREDFSHGGTRNLLVERATGSHVAFLTQDAIPATTGWLAELLRGFSLAPDVALTFGPYLARPDAAPRVRRELDSWFGSFAPDGQPRLDRLEPGERGVEPRRLLGARAFFTDANGCVAKSAWQHVRFRSIAYAEDHQLALDMLFAGYAKVYLPRAAVVHSHDYGLRAQLRRSFDESRGLHEVYGYIEPVRIEALRRSVIGPSRADARLLRSEGIRGWRLLAGAAESTAHHAARFTAALLGTRADHLPPTVRRRLSLEGR